MMRLLACSSAAVLAFAAPDLAMAQEAPAAPAATSSSEEAEPTDVGAVVVTARRREEAVRDVPSTITALSAEQLEAKSPIEGVGDLLQTVPGMRFNGVASENLAEISVRGSGTQRATSADSGVGLFVNGAYVGSSTLGGRNFKRIDYFDLARIEVLEGPQGALYGRNSEFGTVNIVLAQPQFRNGGRVSATYTADLEQIRLEGVVNQQLGDKVAVRFGVQMTDQEAGLYYNPKQDVYYDHTSGYIARGQIRYNDGPIDVTFLYDRQDMDLPTFANQWVIPAGALPALPLGYTGPRYDIPSEVENSLHQDVERVMIIANYDFGWGEVTSTSMWSESHSAQRFSGGVDLVTQGQIQASGQAGFYPFSATATDAHDQTFYQDIHIAGDAADGALQWLAGIEYLAQEDFYVRDVATNPCALTATSGICAGTPTLPLCFRLNPTSLNCPAVFPLPFGSRRVVPSEYQSAAIYGSLKYDIGSFSLGGELRYSRDDKTASQSDFRLYTGVPFGTPTTYTFEEENLSYAAHASYRFGSNLVYAKTGTGYRAGGVNNGTTVPAAPNPLTPTYGNEGTVSYEVGLKSEFGRNIFLRLSAYKSETSDAITLVSDGCTVLLCGQAGTAFNINGGTMETQGIEAQLDAVFQVGSGRFAIALNAANQEGTYTEVAAVAGAPILDSTVAQIPDWTFSANLNYRQPIGTDLFGFFNIAYNGQRGGGQDTVTATAPFIPLEDIDNVDLRFGGTWNKTELAFFVRNATDEVIPVLKLQQGAIPLANRYSRPRTFGATLTYRW
ncbi:TonB-dependent receptor [Caulobacter sp. SLTY]|uniref:TonB-dependent receptor n=1 Tax=Caulobacter sp. SLTY TaxID=2683262 RepID=UPI001412E297|nr:TonB-dependent receptor [Caulobacter sp. SLTY]NBB15147.1 TonB-dependent receptor [Caulobacter sp. SLTY]